MNLKEHGTYVTRHGYIVGPLYKTIYEGEVVFYADNEWRPEYVVETWDSNGSAIIGEKSETDIVAEWKPWGWFS